MRGMRVIVTRPAAEAGEWVEGLRARGCEAVALPLIEIRNAPDAAPLRAAWMRVGSYRAAMFVSANAVRAFFAARQAQAAFTPRAWATGAGTRDALLAAGVPAAQIDSPAADSPQFDSEALWSVVAPQCKEGDRVLIVRGGEAGRDVPAGRDWLADELAARGAQVDTVLSYLRACPLLTPAQRELARSAAADNTSVWLFSSSQGIANLVAQMPGQDWSDAKAVVTHPRIAQAARDASFGVVCVSRPPMDAVSAVLESLG